MRTVSREIPTLSDVPAEHIFWNDQERVNWQNEHGICRNCGGANEARKHLLPSCSRRFMSGKKIYFQKDYWKPVCRKCLGEKKEAALAKELMRAHTASLPARHKCEPGYHFCSKCRLSKPFADFYARKRGTGLTSVCKECKIALVKTYQGTREKPAPRRVYGARGEYLGYSVLPDGGVRRSYANGYSDTFADGSETWTRRE